MQFVRHRDAASTSSSKGQRRLGAGNRCLGEGNIIPRSAPHPQGVRAWALRWYPKLSSSSRTGLLVSRVEGSVQGRVSLSYRHTHTHPVHIHTQRHMPVHTHSHTPIHIHTHLYTYTHTHLYTRTSIHTHTCTHTYSLIHTHTYTHTSIHIHTHTYTLTHTYTHSHTHSQREARRASCLGVI